MNATPQGAPASNHLPRVHSSPGKHCKVYLFHTAGSYMWFEAVPPTWSRDPDGLFVVHYPGADRPGAELDLLALGLGGHVVNADGEMLGSIWDAARKIGMSKKLQLPVPGNLFIPAWS